MVKYVVTLYEFLLETPTKGQVIFEGNDLTHKNVHLDELRQKWGWYFKTLIYFLIKVIDNIMLAPKMLLKGIKSS